MKIKKFTKDHFFFNPETLQYESRAKSIRRTVIRVVSFLLFSFIIAAAYYIAYSVFFDTYSEYAIKRENKILEEHLAELNEKYSQLDEVISDISKRDTNIYSVIFESKPMVISINNKDQSELFESLQSRNNNELAVITEYRLNFLASKIRQQSFAFDSLKKLIDVKREELEFIPSIMPINYNVNAIGASIGEKINPIHKSLHVHTGIDFAVPVGSDVLVTASGTVKSVISKKLSTGTEIIIDHGNDYETRYLYLDEAFVTRGQKVKRGDIIGKVGNIGVTVPHLHYEVRRSDKIADPLNYFFMDLSPEEIQLITAISLNKGQSLD